MLLIQDPELLMLDEPVAGMSVVERAKTAELLKEIIKNRSVKAILLHRQNGQSAGGSTAHLRKGALGSAVWRAPQEQAQRLSRHQPQISTFFDCFRELVQSTASGQYSRGCERYCSDSRRTKA